jgi:hypothetical protein
MALTSGRSTTVAESVSAVNAPAQFPKLAQTADERSACPICSTRETRFHAKAHDIEYCTSSEVYSGRSCDACGVLFLDPMPMNKLSESCPSNYDCYAKGKASTVQKIKEALDRKQFKGPASRDPGEEPLGARYRRRQRLAA